MDHSCCLNTLNYFAFPISLSAWRIPHTEELVVRALKLGYQALAITDECSLAGVVRAHDGLKKSGLQSLVVILHFGPMMPIPN